MNKHFCEWRTLIVIPLLILFWSQSNVVVSHNEEYKAPPSVNLTYDPISQYKLGLNQERASNSSTLTVWSLWRNDTRDYLVPHLRFYMQYWKAERLFLNVGYDDISEISSVVQTLSALCGGGQSLKAPSEQLSGATLKNWTCANGQQVWMLAYLGPEPTPAKHGPFKRKLIELYMELYDTTVRKMYVDSDEFFVPAYGDVNSAREMESYNYHMVMIKAADGERDWTKSMEWVDQPYYYRLRANNMSYPSDGWDGNEPLTGLFRKSHSGPFEEHNELRRIAKLCRSGQSSPNEYMQALQRVHRMYHMSVVSKEAFVSQKRFDQTTKSGMRQGNIRERFEEFFLEPERDFVVFNDSFLFPFFQDSFDWTLTNPEFAVSTTL